MCMYTNRRHMAFVSHPCLVTISLSCWGKLYHLPPEPKNICWLLLWLVEDHTRTRNNIQNHVHTLMKQSYHVPIIRIVTANDLIMSSKLLSKLLCKNNKANSTQTWGRSTTATSKKRLSDNFDKLPKKNRRTGNFVSSGAVFFIYW